MSGARWPPSESASGDALSQRGAESALRPRRRSTSGRRQGGPVEHVFSGAYLREKVVEAGGFDTELTANQDFELDYRSARWAGRSGSSRRSGATGSQESLRALARQMARYGYDKAGTLMSSSFGACRVNSPRRSWWHFSPPRLQLEHPGALRASAAYFTVAFALGAEAGRRDGASPGGQRLYVLLVHIAGAPALRRPRDTLEHGPTVQDGVQDRSPVFFAGRKRLLGIEKLDDPVGDAAHLVARPHRGVASNLRLPNGWSLTAFASRRAALAGCAHQ